MIGRKTKLEQTKEKITGVYMIKDKTEGKVYIGESFDIYRRWEQHKGDLINHRHDNYPLQRLYNEYGMDNLEFSIVHEVKNQPFDEITKLYLLYLEEEELNKVSKSSNRCNIESKRNQFLKTNCHLKGNSILKDNKEHYERMYIYCVKKCIKVIDIRERLIDFSVWEEKYIAKINRENEKKRIKNMIKEKYEKVIYDNLEKIMTREEINELIKDIKQEADSLNCNLNFFGLKSVNYERKGYFRFFDEQMWMDKRREQEKNEIHL